MAIAFFDLDKTLLAVNSGTLWVRREAALGHLSKRKALRAMFWLARYQLGFASAEELVTLAVAEIAGSRADEISSRTQIFYETQVRGTFRPGGLEALARHRAAGDRCVLLTSSSHYLAALVAKELALDGALSNQLEVDERGLHTGRIVGRTCFGPGKLVHASAEARAHGVELSKCAFYTDSFSDLPMLEAVGEPVPVNPDLRLRRLAAKRGWRIADWGEPTPSLERAS